VDLDPRGRRLRAALAAALVPESAPELRLVRAWLDSLVPWKGGEPMRKLFASIMLVASLATSAQAEPSLGKWLTYQPAKKDKYAAQVYRLAHSLRWCPRSISPFEFKREFVKSMDQAARAKPKAEWSPEVSDYDTWITLGEEVNGILESFGCGIL
jgi:hypothetical protein